MSNLLEKYLEQKKQIKCMQQEMSRLQEENQWFHYENNRITSEPYYIRVMKFRSDIKQTFIYRIYCKLRYGIDYKEYCAQQDTDVRETMSEETSEKTKEFDYNHMLYPDEYRFLKYKQRRNNGFRIDITGIQVPYRKDLVSVILPVYNGEDYIELSIDSVLNQTYENFELIIIDDGSTDKTCEILDQYEKMDQRVHVIHQENRKLPRSLSRGFREARGEFLTWTSADNIMHMQMLEKFVQDMKKYNHTSMLYGNIKLIDGEGKPKTDFGWYAHDREHPDYVLFQKNMLELNTYPNNYIGASFMYRAVVAHMIEDYSAYKFGIEDYDYWMKVNELLTLRHASFEEPEYSYRMHTSSLTAKDKELKITENRYRQMMLDDFRRDYFLKQQIWIVESDQENNEAYQSLLACIDKYGQRRITLEESIKQTPNLYERFIYVRFTDHAEKILKCDVEDDKYRLIVTGNAVKISDECGWDCYITTGCITESDFISSYKGWYGIADGEDIFAFADSKARTAFLYKMESDEADFTADENKVSVIVSYTGNEKKLNRCIDSIRNSDFELELLVVGKADELFALCMPENCKKISCLSENDVTRKNVAARMAVGKYIFFIQDDCVVENDYFEKMQQLFLMHERAIAVFGNVEVVTRKQNSKFLRFLGNYEIESDDVYCYDRQNISSPYAFAINNYIYKMSGGFYHCGSVYENEFCGMEYIGLTSRLYRFGYYTMLSGSGQVIRYVDDVTSQDICHIWTNFVYARYELELQTALPYETWPEGIADRAEDIQIADQHRNELAEINKKLLEQVRKDFREKDKVELNRDIFSRLV